MPALSEPHDLADPVVRRNIVCPPGKRFVRVADLLGNRLFYKRTSGGTGSLVIYGRPFKGADPEEEVLAVEGELTEVKVAEMRVRAARMEHIRKVERRNPFVAIKRVVDELTTIADLVEQHLSKLKGVTLKNAKGLYRPLLEQHGKARLVDFGADEIEAFLNKNHQQRPVSAMRLLDYLTAAYYCAGKRKTPRRLPPGVLDLETHKPPTVGLKEEIDWIVNHRMGSYRINWTDDEWASIWEGFRRAYQYASVSCINVLMLELIARTGARPGEIQNLRWNQIVECRIKGEDGKEIPYLSIRLVQHKTARKTGQDRVIRLDVRAAEVLVRAREAGLAAQYLTGDREADLPKRVFFAPRPKERDRDMPPSLLGGLKTLQRYMPRQIPGMKVYNFRSAWINIAGDLLGPESEALVSTLVGHIDPATMELYYRDRGERMLVGVVNAVGEKLPESPAYSPKRPRQRITSGPRKNI